MQVRKERGVKERGANGGCKCNNKTSVHNNCIFLNLRTALGDQYIYSFSDVYIRYNSNSRIFEI